MAPRALFKRLVCDALPADIRIQSGHQAFPFTTPTSTNAVLSACTNVESDRASSASSSHLTRSKTLDTHGALSPILATPGRLVAIDPSVSDSGGRRTT